MRAVSALVLTLAVLGVATPGNAGAQDPFQALALVRLDRGVRAPDFTLTDLTRQPTSVALPAGSAVIVVFWGTW